MNHTLAILILMLGAAALAFLWAYRQGRAQQQVLQHKIQSLNTALSTLQAERGKLLGEQKNATLEMDLQSKTIATMSEQMLELKIKSERLDNDNALIIKEYRLLEQRLREHGVSPSLNG